MRRIICFILLCIGSPLSFADSEPLYYWDIAYLDGRNVYFQGESARKACNELIAYINRRGGSVVYKELHYNLPYPDNRSWVVVDDIIASSVSGSTAYCIYFNSFNQISQERMRKYKKDCPVGSGLSYDMDTGAVVCADKNPCEEKKGQLVSFFAKHSLGWGNDPLYFCMKGCRIMRVASECAGHNDDPINNRACWGMAEYSQGKQCTEGETAATEGGSPPPKDKDPEAPKPPEEPKDPNQPDPEQCPAGYFFNGSFCSPIEPDNEGCPEGQVKQGSHCITPPPTDAPPKKGGGSSGGGGGGSGGGSGSGSDKGNGSGDGKGDGKGEGKGDGKGKGKGGNGGGGTGTGKGECKQGEDCQKEEKSKVEGQSCDADLVCEGDAINCAILKQQKKQYCEWQEDGDQAAELQGRLEGLGEEEKGAFEENSEDIPVSNLFNDALNRGRWLPSGCPSPKPMHVFGKTIYLSWAPLCKFAEWMAPLIVLLASVFFAITTAKAVKGN